VSMGFCSMQKMVPSALRLARGELELLLSYVGRLRSGMGDSLCPACESLGMMRERRARSHRAMSDGCNARRGTHRA
jgi:hypothetical protein